MRWASWAWVWLASTWMLGGCWCGPADRPADRPARPPNVSAAARFYELPGGGSWVECELAPVDARANAVVCRFVDSTGRCEATSTYVDPQFQPLPQMPALGARACPGLIDRASGPPLVAHGAIEVRCDGAAPGTGRFHFCQLGRCIDPQSPGSPPTLTEPPCDLPSLR